MAVFTRNLKVDQGCDFSFTTWPWVVDNVVQDLVGATCRFIIYGPDEWPLATVTGIVPNIDGTVSVVVPKTMTASLPVDQGPLKHELFVDRAGAVASVAMTNNGTGYTAAAVTFTGAGANAAATALVADGEVVRIIVTDPGYGYTTAPAVNITGDGSSAAATASVAAQTTLLQDGAVFMNATVGSV